MKTYLFKVFSFTAILTILFNSFAFGQTPESKTAEGQIDDVGQERVESNHGELVAGLGESRAADAGRVRAAGEVQIDARADRVDRNDPGIARSAATVRKLAGQDGK